MLKFKVGDKIICNSSSGSLKVGKIYTVAKIWKCRWLPEREYLQVLELLDEFEGHSYDVDSFELAIEYLTPEQVLQYFKEGRQDELEYIQPNGVTLNNMTEYTGLKYLFEGEWRVKSVPKTIDYYGTELPKPIDISDLDDSTEVYLVNLNQGKIYTVTVDRAKMTHLSKTALHFSTYEDAKLVLDTILKPFKQ